MSKFVTGISNMVVNECRTVMVIGDMDTSCLMVHAQQIEEEKLKENSREVFRARIGVGNFSNAKFEGQVGLDFDKGFLVKIPIILLLSLIRIGCLTLNFKEEMEVVLLWLDLLV
uniref:Gag-pol protein n=1 Tax=Solanum tuberosum TaxID=4113 RepID=M1DCU0_SOLTU